METRRRALHAGATVPLMAAAVGSSAAHAALARRERGRGGNARNRTVRLRAHGQREAARRQHPGEPSAGRRRGGCPALIQPAGAPWATTLLPALAATASPALRAPQAAVRFHDLCMHA